MVVVCFESLVFGGFRLMGVHERPPRLLLLDSRNHIIKAWHFGRCQDLRSDCFIAGVKGFEIGKNKVLLGSFLEFIRISGW
jgi:hypothetical protein